MLSEVILSRHSYSAVPLAGQQIDQRSVRFGPLVAYSPISRSADYIFILLPVWEVRSWRITRVFLPINVYKDELSGNTCVSLCPMAELSRYGVKPKIVNISFLVFFVLVA